MQSTMMVESLTDALVECVKAAGGSKVVGAKLWPEKMVDAAQRHLLNCLSDGRAEHLTPDQMWLVFKLAREAGCHTGMNYLCESLNYAAPVPVQPVDVAAQLQREVIEASRLLAKSTEKLTALLAQSQTLKAVA